MPETALRRTVASAVSIVLLSTIISASVLAGSAEATITVSAVTFSPSSTVVANGVDAITAAVTVADDAVPPVDVAAQTVTFTPSGAQTVGPVSNLGGGRYSATLTSSRIAGDATVTATVASASPPVSVNGAFTQIAGPPTAVTVDLSPTLITADGISTSTATATVKDVNGNGVPGQTIVLSSTDAGIKFGTPAPTVAGTYTATITGSTTAGTPTITATAGTVFGTAVLTQTAGPPATVTVVLNPTSIIADGTSSSTATATVKDANGNGVTGQIVTFVGSTGQTVVLPVMDHTDGTYTATITSSTILGSATITATDTSVTPGLTSPPATLTQTTGPPAVVAVKLNPASIVADGTATTTATATVTDAQKHALTDLTSQTLVFASSDPHQLPWQWTNAGNGVYTVQIASTPTVGAATITATAGTNASGTATLTQTTGPPATVTVQLNPTSIMANGTSTTTATATIADAQGRPLPNEDVVFSSSDSNHFWGQMSNHGDGTYSVQIRGSTTVGRATISATVAARLTGQATLVQYAGPSYTSLVASPSSLVTNQGVTLVAAVGAGTASPSGTLTFRSRSAAIAHCTEQPITSANPVATCQTSFSASASPVVVTAAFTPDSASTAPASTGTLTIPVKPDSTSVALDVSASVKVGSSTTYTATVTPPASRSGPIVPTGSADFFDNGQLLPSCATRPVMNGGATCNAIYRALGTHSITARYNSDLNFTRSTSRARTIRIVAVPVRTLGMISSTMQWTFHYEPSYTMIAAFAVNGASTRSDVVVTCRGRGCPYAKRSTAVAKTVRCTQKRGKRICPASASVRLAPAFRNHRLGVGAVITVTISRPGWISKYYAFTIQARRAPRILITCLVPGSTRPGVGCSK